MDPLNYDYRLQSDAPLRGQGPDGADPGLHPYRDEVYFVSPQGDDAAEGASVAKAWRTLKHASQRAKPGDTVYVLAGEYKEPLRPLRSGTPEKPIRFSRRGLDRVVLDGGNGLPVGIDLSGRAHIRISGFFIRNFTQAGIEARGGEDLHIEKCIVTGAAGDGVIVTGVKGFELRHNLVRENKGDGLSMIRTSPATVTGNIFDGNRNAAMRCDVASARNL